MAVFEKMKAAMESRDPAAFVDMLHDDFVFVRHQSGTEMNRDEMAAMLEEMSGSDAWTISEHRCVYENDDMMLDHSVMTFPDGSKEAILAAHMLKDGKVVRMETGATKLD